MHSLMKLKNEDKAEGNFFVSNVYINHYSHIRIRCSAEDTIANFYLVHSGAIV